MIFEGKHAGLRRCAAAVSAMVILCVLLSPACRVSAEELQTATLMEALEKVNIRSAPDGESQVLGQLEQYDRIFAVELTAGDWYRVVYQGETGYVRADYLKICGTDGWDAPEAPADAIPSDEIIYPEEEIRKAEEEAEKRASEEAAEQSSAAAAAAREKQEAAAIKKRSTGITIGIYMGAVLLISAYAVYVIAKESKKAGETEQGGGEQDGGEDSRPGDGQMEFLDLGEEKND